MDVVDLPASMLPDEVVANLVFPLRFTHPIVGREPSDNARVRGVLRDCLDRKVLDLHPLRIGCNVEIDGAEFVTRAVSESVAVRP